MEEIPRKTFARKKPRRPGELKSLANILPRLCEEIHFEEKVRQMSLMSIWPLLVEEPYRSHSQAVKINKRGQKTVLTVRVSDPALASELGFQLDTIRRNLNSFTPQTGVIVDQIRFVTGKIS